MATFTIKRNDTSPALKATVKDEDGNAVDLSGYNEARFIMNKRSSGNTVVEEDTSGNVSVTDSQNGKVKYEWQASDTEESGRYKAEFEIEFSDGTIETWPNSDYIHVKILPDLS